MKTLFLSLLFLIIWAPAANASSTSDDFKVDPEAWAIYNVVQCSHPYGWRDAENNDPIDFLSSTFSGFSISGNGIYGFDPTSRNNRYGLDVIGQYGARVRPAPGEAYDDNKHNVQNQIQKLNCHSATTDPNDNRYWLGSSRPNPMQNAWNPADGDVPGQEGTAWWEWLDQRGIAFNGQDDIDKQLLWDAVYVRQNMRTPTGSSVYLLRGRWRSCRGENVRPQLWGQSINAIADDEEAGRTPDIPFTNPPDAPASVYESTWSEYQSNGACDPGRAGLAVVWNPADICASVFATGTPGYTNCKKKYIVTDDSGDTSRDDLQQSGGKLYPKCNPDRCVDGLQGVKVHKTMTEEMSVARVGQMCTGTPETRCFKKYNRNKVVERCWDKKTNAQGQKYIDHKFKEAHENCPAGYKVDMKWSDGKDGIIRPDYCWNVTARNSDGKETAGKWELIGSADDSKCNYPHPKNTPPNVDVPGTKYEQTPGQRAMFSRGLLSVVDRQRPSRPTVTAYEGMTPPVAFPGGNNYRISLDSNNDEDDESAGQIKYSASDAGGGLRRLVVSRKLLGGKAFPTASSIPEPIDASPPLLSLKKPISAPEGSGFLAASMAASPGGWVGAEKFRYQWYLCDNEDCSNKSPYGGIVERNYVVPRLDDVGKRFQVAVSAAGWSGADINGSGWSDWVESDASEPTVSRSGGNLGTILDIFPVVYGVPRVGQWVAVSPGIRRLDQGLYSYPFLYSCAKRAPLKSMADCDRRGYQTDVIGYPGVYKISQRDIGRWLIMGNDNELASGNGYFNQTEDRSLVTEDDVFGFFPGFLGRYDNFWSRSPLLEYPARIDDVSNQPIAADMGIIPEYSQNIDLCTNARIRNPNKKILTKRGILGLSAEERDDVVEELTNRTDPCPRGVEDTISLWYNPEAHDRGSDYTPGDDLWVEGRNVNYLQTFDFCTRNILGNCYNNPSRRLRLDDIVIDKTEPVFSTSALDAEIIPAGADEDKRVAQLCSDSTWLASQKWTGWPSSGNSFVQDPRCTQGVICEPPNGENGWHTSDPGCRFQVVDKFKTCSGNFAYGRIGCSDSRQEAQASLLESVTWWEDGSGSPGNQDTVLDIRDGGDIRLRGLRDGRPAVEVWARDRSGQGERRVSGSQKGQKTYEDFVKIDTRAPQAPVVVDGPSETKPEGYETLCWDENKTGQWFRPGENNGRGLVCGGDSDSTNNMVETDIPRAPDETNDLAPAGGKEDCDDDEPLCWKVMGLEEGDGGREPEAGQDWDRYFNFDHEARLQCQLVWGGTGRTPADQPADWVDPPWPLNMSGLREAGRDARPGATVPGFSGENVVLEETGWDCGQTDHGGDTWIAPFKFGVWDPDEKKWVQRPDRPDGHYLLRVRQKDRAGLVSPWAGRPLVFDRTPPESGVLVNTETESLRPENSATRQWLFRWGWDLLARDGFAGSYCFVSENETDQIVRRSGWGCGPTAFPDDNYDVNGPAPDTEGYATLRRDLPGQAYLESGSGRALETPMPFPGIAGEGRGTLAGLPDGSYRLGFWQRDKLGQKTEVDQVCDSVSVASDDATCIAFTKNTGTIGPVPEPTVELEAELPRESVTSRRTEAELTVRAEDPLLSSQAFFPMSGSILHATPQNIYSYCQTMDQNYAEYMPGNLSWSLANVQTSSTPSLGSGFCPGEDEPSENLPTAVRHAGSLALSDPDPASAMAEGNFTLNIFWLRPTLADPQRPSLQSAYSGGTP